MQHESSAFDSDWDVERVTVGRNFVRDMEGLWSQVLRLAAVVEEAVDQSIRALCDGRVELAEELKRQKRAVDGWEVQIERECVRMLALHQPVASDLRRVAVVLKINGDLVRLCDLALHIAKRAKKLAKDPEAVPISHGLESLALGSLTQLHESLDAADQQVDWDYRVVQKALKEEIIRDPDRIDTWLRLVNTARNLERIADHASKIAEAVIYLKEGAILRHRPARNSTDSSLGQSEF
jgi:phosphate transport system protein